MADPDSVPVETISSDLPLTDPAEDRLGYAVFAQRIATALLKIPSPEGFVIAINGEWGLGKSTILSFITHYLSLNDEDIRPLIVQFSPWMFSGAEDLALRFCKQLFSAINNDPGWKTVAQSIKTPITKLAAAVSEIPGIGSYGKAVVSISKVFDNDHDIHAFKKLVSAELLKQKRKIIVTIDDIDRLTPEEMQQLFRVVKAVANFPNVIYVLAFDKAIVSRALSTDSVDGSAYLEKIVQAQFDIPLPSRVKLGDLLIRDLNIFIGNVPEEQYSQEDWNRLYPGGIEHFLATPRQIIRLMNSLTVTFSMVEGEVNPIDFIAIETLRLFCPDIYDLIRKNKHEFVSNSISGNLPGSEAQSGFHSAWLGQVPLQNQSATKQIVQVLFPKLNSVFSPRFDGVTPQSKQRKQYKVCVEDRFDAYFSYALPDGMLSRAEINNLRSKTSDVRILTKTFEQLLLDKTSDRSTNLRNFLDVLEDYADEIPVKHLPNVIECFFSLGDRIAEVDDEQGLLTLGMDMRLSRIISRSLMKVDMLRRFEIIRDAAANGIALYTIVYEITIVGADHERYGYGHVLPNHEQFLKEKHINALEKLGVGRIREAASSNTLLSVPELMPILYSWRNWTDEEEVKAWVAELLETDQGLMNFLEGCLIAKISHKSGNIQNIAAFADLAQIADRLGTIGKSGLLLTDRQIKAADMFFAQWMSMQNEEAIKAKMINAAALGDTPEGV